jgi:hypothetical protein
MPATRTASEPLRRAMANARLREVDVAAALRVDPKTVQRWLGGRLPQPRHRWGLAELLERNEYDLWPQLAGDSPHGGEVRATYPHRGAVPRDVWQQLFAGAEREIGILVYSGLFIAEDVGLLHLISTKAAEGVAVRILLGDPDGSHVTQRGVEEGISDAMAAKIRNSIVLFGRLADTAGVEIRLHPTVLYNSIYRADDELLVNQHVFGVAAASAPVLHLRGSGAMVGTYLESFERVWSGATPLAGVSKGSAQRSS